MLPVRGQTALSYAGATYGKFLIVFEFGRARGERCCRFFPLPRPTAKTPLRSKQPLRRREGKGSSVKCLGLTAGDSFSPHPLSHLAYTLPASSQRFAHPGRARSLAHFLLKGQGIGCYAGYELRGVWLAAGRFHDDKILPITISRVFGLLF